MFMGQFTASTCRTCQELSTDYLFARDELNDARLELNRAVTVMQREGALTRFGRVAAHKRYCMDQLLTHCEQAGCAIPIADFDLERLGLTRHLDSFMSPTQPERQGAA